MVLREKFQGTSCGTIFDTEVDGTCSLVDAVSVNLEQSDTYWHRVARKFIAIRVIQASCGHCIRAAALKCQCLLSIFMISPSIPGRWIISS